MAVKIKTKSGMIDIDNDVISSVVGGAATDNYGVVGMASRNPVRSFEERPSQGKVQSGINAWHYC